MQFVEDFKTAAVEMGGAVNANPFLKYTDVVVKDDELPATVWCWWQAVGTELQGCALIKVGETGVLHEKIAYFSSLPEKQERLGHRLSSTRIHHTEPRFFGSGPDGACAVGPFKI